MIKVAICDDELGVCAVIEDYVEDACKNLKVKADISVYDDGKALCKALQEGERFALILLDIELPEFDGVAIGDYIREVLKDNTIQIAYISGNEGYAMRLFDVRPINFMVKPITYQQIEKVLSKTLMLMSELTKMFMYKKKQDMHFIEYRNIMYFKSDNRKVQIVLQDHVEEFYGKLELIYDQLSKQEFLYIHKSYIVNISYVRTFHYESLTLMNGEVLPIAQSKRKKIRCEQLGLFLGGDK